MAGKNLMHPIETADYTTVTTACQQTWPQTLQIVP